MAGLAATKAQLIALFKQSDAIEVWRGMSCDKEWALSVTQGDDVGDSWSWQQDGALKGSSLDWHGAKGVMLKGVVDESDVDWAMTIAVQTFHEDECEIVITDPSSVTLTTIVEFPSGEVIRDFSQEPSPPSM